MSSGFPVLRRHIRPLGQLSNGAQSSLHPVLIGQLFITVRLKPQMKKYRCLWCMSTSNHNIWYFGHVCRHLIAKPRHSAVESSKRPCLERFLHPPTAPEPLQTEPFSRSRRSIPSLAPIPNPNKPQKQPETVHFDVTNVRMWTTGVYRRPDWNQAHSPGLALRLTATRTRTNSQNSVKPIGFPVPAR
jgi:hypothetical protein